MPNFLSQLTFPVIVVGGMLLVLIALFAVLRILARNWIKVAPNEVLVIYGRRYRMPDGSRKGFKLVTGGAAFCIPLMEKFEVLPLDAFQTKFSVRSVPSEQGVRVTVTAVASLKIGREIEMLEAAVSRFLDKTLDEIKVFAQEVLEGGLRGVVAIMTVEELVKERTAFGARVQEQVTGDLNKLGLILDNFLIQDISDEHGYIDALGRTQTAVVKRDAAIGEANAKRDEEIRVAEAQREADENASSARRVGETAKADADKQISNAQQIRDVRIAENNALVKAMQARIEIAAQIAAAEEDKKLRVTKVAAEEAEVEARTELQKKEMKRRDAELEATIIVQANREKESTIIRANAEREAVVITAEGTKQAAILKAEGEREAKELSAQAERVKMEQEAEGGRAAAEQEALGRKAQASAHQSEMEAEGLGNQAKLRAEAEGRKAQAVAHQAELEAEAKGTQAKLEAEAKGILAKLEAEAEGIRQKAQAYTQLDQSAKLLLIIENAPELIARLGEAIRVAGEGTIAPIGQAIGTGLSSVEEIRIVDLGGGNGQGGDPLSRFMNAIPKSVFNLAQQAHGTGVQDVVRQLAQKAGIDLSSLLESGDSAASAASTAARDAGAPDEKSP